jgi:hypothetical protein
MRREFEVCMVVGAIREYHGLILTEILFKKCVGCAWWERMIVEKGEAFAEGKGSDGGS